MKVKNVKIKIRSVKSIKEEWKKAISGKVKSLQKDNEIVLIALETVEKIFTKNRLGILKIIIDHSPQSIYELAKVAERDFRNVHADVTFLAEVGLLSLKESKNSRKGLIPVARLSGIELDFAA